MRLILASILAIKLWGIGAAQAEERPHPAQPTMEQAEAGRKLSNRPIDYGDIRCGFAIRHHGILDSQIVAWASGFIEGYLKPGADRAKAASDLNDIVDPIILRGHIRGYCLEHHDKSLQAALIAIVKHPRASATIRSPAYGVLPAGANPATAAPKPSQP